MPDTYTSQFSGEEIDSALRAAQIISGADTPAELRKKLEIRGDTIPVSATDPTPVSEALTASGGGVNPNLLDNWFFGNPVNQRKGYYIPAGVEYNDLSWKHAGTTDKAYPVVGYSGQDPLITIDGTNYIVGVASQVPGYCDGYSYSIDRWKSEGNIVVTFESDGISLENVGVEAGQFKQELPPDFSPEGTLLCISAIVKSASGDARLLLSQSNSPWEHTIDFIPLQTGFFSGSGNLVSGNHKFSIYLGAGAKIKLAAVKLELGSTQTLAHKEGDKWVLNEIPDFGEQLRRCQRHAFSPLYEAYATAVICNLFVSSVANGVAFGEVTLPVSMRNKPVFSGNASKFWIVAENGGGASHPTAISVMGLSADKVMIQVNGSYAANTQYILYVEDPFTSSDFLLSADL